MDMNALIDQAMAPAALIAQPNCPVCGRFAAKDRWGCWYFKCVSGNQIDGWEHD